MRKLLILLALVWLIFWVTYADSSSSGEESTPPRYIAFFDDGQDDEDWDEDEEDWDEDEEHEDDESFDDAQEDWDWRTKIVTKKMMSLKTSLTVKTIHSTMLMMKRMTTSLISKLKKRNFRSGSKNFVTKTFPRSN